MRPTALQTKIFLDSGNPKETQDIVVKLGFLDGQTTNPSLFAKNPDIQTSIQEGRKYTRETLSEEYKNVIQNIKSVIPQGIISIEVYADSTTKASEIVTQAEEMNTWIENAYIKLPITKEGLKAAKVLSAKGINLNMTLCFSQEQAAAVYSSTKGAKAEVLLSPFQGRLDDNCKDGTDLIMNIQRMFAHSDKHVRLVTSSVRDYKHFLYAIFTKPDFVTAPYSILSEWFDKGLEMPGIDIDETIFEDKTEYFKDINDSCIVGISYKELDLSLDWNEYDIFHELTEQGLLKFSSDWNTLFQ